MPYYSRMDDLYMDLKISRKEIGILYNQSYMDDYNAMERAIESMADVQYDPYAKPRARSLDGISIETKTKLWLVVEYSKSCHCKAHEAMRSDSKLMLLDREGKSGLRAYFNKWITWRNTSVDADESKIDLM